MGVLSCQQEGSLPKASESLAGPGEVVNWLSEVLYWVRMPGQGRVVVLHQ